jgi:hypothetical protein
MISSNPAIFIVPCFSIGIHPIPTIVFTNSSDPDDINKSYLLGANAFHTKPIGMAGLCQMLKKIYAYWMDVDLPNIDKNGNLKFAASDGKLGGKMHPVVIA